VTSEHRRARRAFVAKAHPDAGGDPEVFRLGMEAIDSAAGNPAPSARSRIAGHAGRLARDWRKLPGEVRRAYREGRSDGSDGSGGAAG
jgi:hypothetical protein